MKGIRLTSDSVLSSNVRIIPAFPARAARILLLPVVLLSRRPWAALALMWAILSAVKAILSLFHFMPAVWGDTVLYLSRARNLVESGLPLLDNLCGPDYPPLYSFFLVPAYWVPGTPDEAFHLALLINAIISSTIVFPAFLLHRSLTGKTVPSLVVAGLAGIMPATFGYSQTIMAENIMLPMVVWIFWLTLRFRELSPWGALSYGLLISFTILAKSLALGMVPGALYLGLAHLSGNLREPGKRLLCLLGLVAGIVLPWGAWQLWEKSALLTVSPGQAGTYPYRQYLEVLLSLLSDFDAFVHFSRIAAKQLAYLFFGTLSLAGMAGVGVIDRIFSDRGNRAPWIAVVMFAAGILGLSVMHCVSYFSTDPERYSLFGRYVDSLGPALFILGAAFLHDASRRTRLLWMTIVVAVLCTLTIPYPLKFWPHRFSIAFLQPIRDWLPFRLLMVLWAAVPLCMIAASRRRIARMAMAFLLALVFALSSAVAYVSAYKAGRWIYQHDQIISYLRDEFVPGKDRLLMRKSEFTAEACFTPRHWLILYQTEVLPVLFEPAERPPGIRDDEWIFVVTKQEYSAWQPAAEFGGIYLFHVPFGDWWRGTGR